MGSYDIWIRWLCDFKLIGARIMLISHRFIDLHVLKILLHFIQSRFCYISAYPLYKDIGKCNKIIFLTFCISSTCELYQNLTSSIRMIFTFWFQI